MQLRQESTTILQSGTPKDRYKIRCLPEIDLLCQTFALNLVCSETSVPIVKRFGDSMLFLCLESKKHPDAMCYIWTKVLYGYNSSLQLNLTRKQHSSSQWHIIPLLRHFPETQWHMWSSGLSILLAVTDYISHTKRSNHLNSQWSDTLPRRKHNKTSLSDSENSLSERENPH